MDKDCFIAIEKKTISITLTEACNLNCIYCYERIKTNRRMPVSVAKEAIIATFDRAKQEKTHFVEILFHGGEPFIAFELIKEICEWLWAQEWGNTKYMCNATTNGTLVHGKIKEWLFNNQHRFVAGLSLDGTSWMQNRSRSNSYNNIEIEFFKNTWPDQGVKMTPSPGTMMSLADGVIHLHKTGFRNTNCSFANGINWEQDEFGTPLNFRRVLYEQLQDLASYYLANPDVKPIEMIHMDFVALAAGKGSVTKRCGAGTIMRCWTPDGQCLPCHLFYEASKIRISPMKSPT